MNGDLQAYLGNLAVVAKCIKLNFAVQGKTEFSGNKTVLTISDRPD